MSTSRGRWTAAVVAVAIVAGATSSCSSPVRPRSRNPYPLDDVLRLNQVQVLGTHNSYHQRPSTGVPGLWSDYEHPPLDVQLGEQGVRSVELDVANAAGFPVQHDPFFDDRSSCTPLAACLGELKAWSGAHPGHLPIFVLIDAKDPSAIFDPVRDEWDRRAFDRLDEVLVDGLGPDGIVTPDDVRGDAPTLRNAVVSHGWPKLEEVRGKFVLVLNRVALRREYLAGHPSLGGRPMFVPAYENGPAAAFIERDDPTEGDIGRLVRKGFIVRTRADADGVEVRAESYSRSRAAIDSGAQIVSTDYPVPDLEISGYVVRLPNERAIRCNPVTAPSRCRSSVLENPRGLRR